LPALARRAEVTEAEARAALRAFVGVGSLERWVADQRWEAIPDGWQVRERFQGDAVRLERVAGGVRVVMPAPDGEAMVWTVPRAPA
jgi:hypothetical protein